MNSTGEKKIRSFIALKPPAEWEQAFVVLQDTLAQKLSGHAFRWVDPRQVHITLRFFGSILPAEARQVSERLTGIAARVPSFTLEASELGCFPSSVRPRVLWVGVRGDLSAIKHLYSEVEQATSGIGERSEGRDFTAHLTIARLKEPSRSEILELRHWLERPFSIEIPWRVSEILLMQSHLLSTGSRYETLSMHPLARREA